MKNTITNRNGYELDFTVAIMYMDDEIRESLHNEMSPCTEQEFFTAYEKSARGKIRRRVGIVKS